MVFINHVHSDEKLLWDVSRIRNDINHCKLSFSGGSFSFAVIEAVRDLLLLRDRSWKVRIRLANKAGSACGLPETFVDGLRGALIREIRIFLSGLTTPNLDAVMSYMFQPHPQENKIKEICFNRCILTDSVTRSMRAYAQKMRGEIDIESFHTQFWGARAGNVAIFMDEVFDGSVLSIRKLSIISEEPDMTGDLASSRVVLQVKELMICHNCLSAPEICMKSLFLHKDCTIRKLYLTGGFASRLAPLLDALKRNDSVKSLQLGCYDLLVVDEEMLMLFDSAIGIEELSIFSASCPGSSVLSQICAKLQTDNTSLERIEWRWTHDGFDLQKDHENPNLVRLVPYLNRNWAGRRLLLSQSQEAPAALWPHVLGRISSPPNKCFTRDKPARPSDRRASLSIDSMYHLIRNTDAVLSSPFVSIASESKRAEVSCDAGLWDWLFSWFRC